MNYFRKVFNEIDIITRLAAMDKTALVDTTQSHFFYFLNLLLDYERTTSNPVLKLKPWF